MRGVQDAPALRLERIFARQAKRLRLVELPGTNRDEIEVLVAGAAIRSAQIEPPARRSIRWVARTAGLGPTTKNAPLRTWSCVSSSGSCSARNRPTWVVKVNLPSARCS